MDFSPWGHKASDTTEQLSLSLFHLTLSAITLEVKYGHRIFTGEDTEAQRGTVTH